MPESLYSTNAAKLTRHDAIQSVNFVVSPLEGKPEITIDPLKDVVQGSVSIDRYSATGDNIELGSVCAAELTFQLYNEDGRFSDKVFEGAEIFVILGLANTTYTENKKTVWDGDSMQCVSASYYSTDRVRVIFSAKKLVSGPFWCSHFQFSETSLPGQTYVYKTSGNEVGLVAPRDNPVFGSLFSGDATSDKAIVDTWLAEQYQAGTPFTVIESIENEIEGTFMALGRYTVDKAPRKTQVMTVKALDRMAQFNRVFASDTISFPCTIESLLRAICTKVNIPYSESSTLVNGDVIVPESPNDLKELDYTYRDYLIWIAEATGTCAFVDENGQLTLKRYDSFGDVTAQLTPDMRLENTADLYEQDITVTGVQATISTNEKYMYGVEGYLVNIENNQLINQMSMATIQTVLQNIYDSGWGGLTYRPYSATVKSVPWLWPLDKVQYKTIEGDIVNSLVTHSTWNLNANSSLKAKGQSSVTSGYAKSDFLTRRERLIIDTLSQDTHKQLDSMETATIQLNSMIMNSMGLYFTEVDDGAGGKKVYAHNSSALEDSTTIYTMNDGGFAWTNSGWNDGSPVWSSGMDKNGNAVLKAIAAYHISADDIEAGVLRSQNDQSYLNLNDGTFSFAGGNLSWSGDTLSVTGQIAADSGSVGGWNIADGVLSAGDVDTDYVWLNPTMIGRTGHVFTVRHNETSQFYVNGLGKLVANNAEITGKITASSGSIGLWTISSGALSNTSSDGNNKIALNPVSLGTTLAAIQVMHGGMSMFTVSGKGILSATGANITGTINATSGTIGGWDIGEDRLARIDGTTGTGFWPDNVGTTSPVISVWDKNTYYFQVSGLGRLKAKDADIEGKITAISGAIGGWNIADGVLSAGDISTSYVGFNPSMVGETGHVFTVRHEGSNLFYVTGQGKTVCADLSMTGGTIKLKSTSSGESFIETSGATGNGVLIGAGGIAVTRNSAKMVYGYEPGSSTAGNATLRFYDSSDSLKTTISINGITSTPVYSNTSSGGKIVYVSSSGYFYASSSSKRYKRDVTTVITNFSPENLLLLPLKQYRYNKGYFADDPNCEEYFCGFIAEDVAELYPHAVSYNAEGQVEMWDVQRIVPPMLNLIQKLYKRVEALENKLQEVLV